MSQLIENIGEKALKRRFKSVTRNKSIQSFQSANTAVILFDGENINSIEPIKEFTKYLAGQQIKGSVVGFINQKEVPQEMLLWQNIEYITKKDLNWYGKPKGAVAEAFLKKEPDMLFVISEQRQLSIEFLAQLSKAKFKIGCFTEDTNDYDLMINPGEKKCEVSFFLEQVIHYIHMFNTSK